MSIVIVAGMVLQLLVAARHGQPGSSSSSAATPIPFMQQPEWFRTIYVGSEVWQTVGWGTILYLAALTTIDHAPLRGGAHRRRQPLAADLARHAARHPPDDDHAADPQHRHVHGGRLREDPAALQPADCTRPPTSSRRTCTGWASSSSNFSYATAIGLFEAVIGLTLILSANAISRRTVGTSLW